MVIKKKILSFKGQGFTLIELTIVLAVIAILIGVFVIPMSNIMHEDSATAMEAAVNKTRNAIYDYTQDNGSFPQSLNNLISPYDYLNNISVNNNSIIVPNVGSIGYNNNTISPCNRQSLTLSFSNNNVCQNVYDDLNNQGLQISNNCSNNQIVLCL